MIFCPTVKDYSRLKSLLYSIPIGLLDLLFSRGLSIRVLKGGNEDFKYIYNKLERDLYVHPPDNRYPHESAHYDPGTKQIIMFRRNLYSTYNVPLHELGHAVDYLGNSKVSPLSNSSYVNNKISCTPHLNEYTRTMDEGRGVLTEHFATCFSAFFCEPIEDKLYGYHSIDELHPETIKYIEESLVQPLEK